MKTIIITGGAGFIGSNLVHYWLAAHPTDRVINLDKLTYAGNPRNLADLEGDRRHIFVHGDINDAQLIDDLLERHAPDGILHLAAESHVDRSIVEPLEFVRTNMLGTATLLNAALRYWRKKPGFRFLHVSTDEVFGELESTGYFTEETPYRPNSPYSASKAGSDHLVRAYGRTYGLPVIVTYCSNNYGPYQFPEKLIPLMIQSALRGDALPVYGDGSNVRDWLYVEDHCRALDLAFHKGKIGETYAVGGRSERSNLEVVRILCRLLDEMVPDSGYRPHEALLMFVPDRPGHDFRYAIDPIKIEMELGWKRRESFESGIRRTVRWYLENREWVQAVRTGEYLNWIEQNYGDRTKLVEKGA